MFIPEISETLSKRHTSTSIHQARNIEEVLKSLDKQGGRRLEEGITIDGLSSPDLDDGLSLQKLPDGKGWILKVHIASPTELIEIGSPIDLEAQKRVTSIYFGESHILHMLPNLIATNLASLNHKKHRLALTLELEINRDFEIVRKDLYKSTFFNRQRHHPESFMQALANTTETEHEMFSELHILARGLFQRRDTALRIAEFDDADRRIVLGEYVPGHNNSHISSFVIQECMIIANRMVAEIMKENHVAGLYRLHMPEYENKDLPKKLYRAEYAAGSGFHRGLGIAPYMHFTSPIRRYADYFSHRALLCLLEGRNQIYSFTEVQDFANYLNMQLLAVLSHQKEELLDMHGKRIMRKGKQRGEGEFGNGLLSHLKYRTQNKLRTPPSVRTAILQKIQTGNLEEWMIRYYLLSGEREIQQAIKQAILQDTKVRKYVSLLGNMKDIYLEEQYKEQEGKIFLSYNCQILGESFEIREELLGFSQIYSKKFSASKHSFFVKTEQGNIYQGNMSSYNDVNSRALKQVIIEILDMIIPE